MKNLMAISFFVLLFTSCAQVEEKSANLWKGVPAIKLEQHQKLKSWKRSVVVKTDGTEEWSYRSENDESSSVKCDGVICSVDENPKVCNAIFIISKGVVADHRLEGRCEVVGVIEPEQN